MFIVLLIGFCIFIMHQEIKPKNSSPGIMVSRSTPKIYPSTRIECGNCRGTGLDGFGIMPDSFECEACEGVGSHKIDPNAKHVTWEELKEQFKIEDEK